MSETVSDIDNSRPGSLVQRLRHIPELDGIRGIAALMAFFHHVCNSTMHPLDQQAGWPAAIRLLFRVSAYGDHGVDLFFALSGFLITSILIGERGSARYYQDFYWKRVLRIIPLYFVVLFIVILFTHQVGYVVLSVFFLVNFASVFHVAGTGPFWTLAIEEQFYLLWPTVVRRRSLTEIRRWAIGLGVLAIALRVLFAFYGKHNYSLTFLRCDGLAFGAFLACHFSTASSGQARRRLDPWLLALAAAGVVLSCGNHLPLSVAMSHAVAQTGVVFLSGSLIGLAISKTGSRWLAPLRSRTLTFFGLVSYALYMVHLYVIFAWDHLRGPLAAGDVRGYWLRFGVIFAVSILLSILSRYLIELPALRLRRFVLKHPKLDAEETHPSLPLAQM